MAKHDEPFPMGAQEIRERLGVSTQRAYIIVGRKDFPDPWRVLARGKVWRSTDVEAWIREHRPEIAEDVEGE